MENLVDFQYEHTGASSDTDALGMREMQAMVYAQRDRQHLLVKAPPASGKSRAMMFVALDKLTHQGIRKVIVAVPQKNIGRSFNNTELKKSGFFCDWAVLSEYDLCGSEVSETRKTERFKKFLVDPEAKTLVCTHATLLNVMQTVDDAELNDLFFGIDEFHHGSADEGNRLGNLIRRLLNNTSAHILAMTGSYFRGDSVPVMRPEDEAKFSPAITYTYYQQLNGYRYLKSLGIGYQFFQGKYISAIPETLDLNRKTIIHIPNVNSHTAYANKHDQVDDIIKCIGKVVNIDHEHFLYTVETANGKRLKVADLVEDNEERRSALQRYLKDMHSRDALDILIALGTAKEGFDWEWCECCLTIGIRASLTEVVQIIGRCTRDCEGKEHAQFINLIPSPDAERDDVAMAVNDMIKAISVSLLMEQVMAPKWTYRTKPEPSGESGGGGNGEKTKKTNDHTLEIIGFDEPSEKVRAIVESDLTELKATLYSHDIIKQALAKSQLAETITQSLIPKIIEEKYPKDKYGLTDEELEQLRQQVVLSLATQGCKITLDDAGNKFINLAGHFINLNKLSINLIDSINPFQRAYEILSKSLTPKVFAAVQTAIEKSREDMTKEEAILLFKKWKEECNGVAPSFNDPDPLRRRMAVALDYLRKLKASRS